MYCIHAHVQMHEFPAAIQPAARQQLWVPNMLLVARLFQALPRLTELKLAVPAAVVFAAIRFWCAADQPYVSISSQCVASPCNINSVFEAAAAELSYVLVYVWLGSTQT